MLGYVESKLADRVLSRWEYFREYKRRVVVACSCGIAMDIRRFSYSEYKRRHSDWLQTHHGEGHQPCTCEEACVAYRERYGNRHGMDRAYVPMGKIDTSC